MMRKLLLAATLLLGNMLPAQENLLTNTDFSAGTTGWWSSMSKAIKADGGKQQAVNGRWEAWIPAQDKPEPTGVLFGHGVRLKSGKTYRLSYTLTTEKPGVMRHLYQMSQRPWRALGLVENVPVQPGTTRISKTFTVQAVEPGTPTHITFNLSKLNGKVVVGDFSLEETVKLSISALNKKWIVFSDVAPPSPTLKAIPATMQGTDGKARSRLSAELKNGAIDLLALSGGKIKPRTRAVLFNEFTSATPANIELGCSADWWMDIKLNGKSIHSTLASGNGSQNYSPNDHVLELPVERGKNLLTVQVLSGSKGWRFVCGTPDPPITYQANDEWKAPNMEATQIQPGSALDLSSQVATPAGKLGRLTIGADGSLVFTDAPKTPVRLLGFNGFSSRIWMLEDDQEFRAQVRLFAQAARRQGYSLFRVHGSFDRWLCLGATEDMSIQPKQLDRWDYLLSEFKREGIYFHLVIFSFGLYERSSVRKTTFEERDRHKLHFYLGGEWERIRFRYGAETVLNHVNPYTGMAWKDDPAIAFLEFYNEQALGLDRMGKTLKDFPETKAFLEREWRQWLRKRHGENLPASLLAELKGTPLAEAPLPRLYDRKSELANEFALFRMTIEKQCADWCEKVVRGTGYKGLTTQYNGTKKLGGSAVRWNIAQVVDMHAYYRHPIGGWGAPGCRVGQSSSLVDAAGYWRNTCATRLSGRPFIVSEFNHCFWNPYQHEGGLVFGAYSALQGFSALQIHSGPVTLEGKSPKVGSFTCGTSPVVRASEFLSACLFQRGDVKKADHQVELVVPEKTLKTGSTSMGAVSTQQSRLALMTGFSLAFPWAERPVGTTAGGKVAMRILPSGVASVDAQDWVVNVLESKDGKFSLENAVAEMKTKGILGEENRSAPEAEIFQSDTGQITMRSRDHLLKVETPRSEAVSLEAGKAETLGILKVENSTVPACIALCSVTSAPLASSQRMVLLYSTEMVNTDMQLSYNRVEMKRTGRSPALTRCGKLSVILARDNPGDLSLYALGFDGSRRQKLATSVVPGGLRVEIDTATLADGPTSFFEIVSSQHPSQKK